MSEVHSFSRSDHELSPHFCHQQVSPLVVDMGMDDDQIKRKVLDGLGADCVCPMFAVSNYGFEPLFAELVAACHQQHPLSGMFYS
eukprot:SAG31_NODE_1428_length_8391_cov_4.335866_3_plen_85_part_00